MISEAFTVMSDTDISKHLGLPDGIEPSRIMLQTGTENSNAHAAINLTTVLHVMACTCTTAETPSKTHGHFHRLCSVEPFLLTCRAYVSLSCRVKVASHEKLSHTILVQEGVSG